MAELKIDLIVDNKGSIKIEKFSLDAEKNLFRIERGFDSLNRKSAYLGDGLKSALAGLGGAVAVKELIAVADKFTNLESRLRLVTDSEKQLLEVEAQLFKMSQQTRGSFEGSVDLYTRLAQSTKGLKIAQDDLLSITKGINQSLLVSGAGGESARAALIQLGQGLASGALRGEELNSILEQTPRLAQMIADGLGVGLGKLREFGAEGGLATSVVLKALLSQTASINAEFARMEATVSQAGQVLKNTLESLVGDANRSSGATKNISESIIGLSQTIDQNRDSILSLFQGVVTGAEWSTQRISNMIQSIKGAAAVAAGALDLSDFATMNPDQLKGWMQDFENGTSTTKKRLAEIKEELAGLKDSDFGAAPKMASLNKQARDLEEQLAKAAAAQATLGGSAQALNPALHSAAGATINLSNANKGAKEAAKAQREEIRQTVAEARRLTDSYKNSTSALNDWIRQAENARGNMVSLNFDHGAAGSGEVARLLAERNKSFDEGVQAIHRYNMALAESDQVVSRAQSEYARAQEDFAIMRKGLAGLSEAEQGNRLAPFADALQEKAQATRKALAEQMKLNSANSDGALTEERLRQSLFDTSAAMYELSRARMRDLESSGAYIDNIKAGLMQVSEASGQAGTQIADAIKGGFDQSADAIAGFATKAKFDFSNMADSFIYDMARISAQQSFTGPLASGLSDLIGSGWSGFSSMFSLNAKGNVYDSPSLSAYSNEVYTAPRTFAFARGAGIFAEAGPEAIMPLTRTASGDLGVRSSGGTNVVVNVIESQSKAGTQQQRVQNGANVIDVFVSKVKSSIATDIASGSGLVPDALAGAYNLNRAAGRY